MNEFLQRPFWEVVYSAILAMICQFLAFIYQVAPSLLLTTRGSCHLLIFLLVVGYKAPEGSVHKRVIGFCAGIFAGANAAEAYRVAYNFDSFIAYSQPPLVIIMIGVLFFVAYAKGNLAKFLPMGHRGVI